jgi:hypothetical protein
MGKEWINLKTIVKKKKKEERKLLPIFYQPTTGKSNVKTIIIITASESMQCLGINLMKNNARPFYWKPKHFQIKENICQVYETEDSIV